MDNQFALESIFIKDEPMYAGRISKVNSLSLDHTMKFFNQYRRVIVSEEGTGKGLHHHILVSDPDITRNIVKDKIKEAYPMAKGNKMLYARPAVNKTQLMKYTLKEGNFRFKGFSQQMINSMLSLSIPKTSVATKITDLEDKYILGQINGRTFRKKYISIKVEHNQNLYDNHIIAYFKRMTIKKQGEEALDMYVDTIEDKMSR